MFKTRPAEDQALISHLKLTDPATLLATWLGLGLIYPAPGTWGSLGAIPLYLAIYATLGITGCAITTMFLIILGGLAIKKFQTTTNTQDNKMIVIDEVIGQMIALLPAALNPALIICAFIAFRIFDIKKPWPICVIDRNMKTAWGVMLDDIIAGCFAALCVLGLSYAKFS